MEHIKKKKNNYIHNFPPQPCYVRAAMTNILQIYPPTLQMFLAASLKIDVLGQRSTLLAKAHAVIIIFWLLT